MASLNKLNKYLYNMNPMMGNQLCNLFLNTTLCCNWLINLMLGDQLCKLLNVLLIQFFFLIYKLPSLFYTFFFIYLQNCLIFIFIFWKHRYEMLTNGIVQNKCKVGILGAKFGNHVGSVEAKALFSKVPTL